MFWFAGFDGLSLAGHPQILTDPFSRSVDTRFRRGLGFVTGGGLRKWVTPIADENLESFDSMHC